MSEEQQLAEAIRLSNIEAENQKAKLQFQPPVLIQPPILVQPQVIGIPPIEQADSYEKFLKEQEDLLQEASKNKVVKLSDVTVVIEDYFGAPPEPAWPPLAPVNKLPEKVDV